MKVWSILILFVSISVGQLAAQKVVINGKEGNRPLVWSDFTGKVDKSSPFAAYTRWKSSFKFGAMLPHGDSLMVSGFEIIISLDPENSWAKKDKTTDELLLHEQGHFNVGLLYMKEVLQKVPGTAFSRLHYQQEIQTLLTAANKKYDEMSQQYDKETDHSKNKEAQGKWDAFFVAGL